MSQAASSLLREVLELCRLRGAPERLPYSPRLFATLFVAGGAVDALIAMDVSDAGTALAHSLLGSVVVLGLCAIALAIRGLANRYVQTATALLACGLVVSLAQWPLLWMAGPLPVANPGATPAPPAPSTVLLAWLSLGLLAWQLLVYARIMRAAMESTMPFALALVISWLVAYWALDGVLL